MPLFVILVVSCLKHCLSGLIENLPKITLISLSSLSDLTIDLSDTDVSDDAALRKCLNTRLRNTLVYICSINVDKQVGILQKRKYCDNCVYLFVNTIPLNKDCANHGYKYFYIYISTYKKDVSGISWFHSGLRYILDMDIDPLEFGFTN